MRGGVLRTLAEARAALQDRLRRDGVDNAVAATRALIHVASRFRPEASSSWDALQIAAERELTPFFNGTRTAAKAVSWTLLEVLQREANRESQAERAGQNDAPLFTPESARFGRFLQSAPPERQYVIPDVLPLNIVGAGLGFPQGPNP